MKGQANAGLVVKTVPVHKRRIITKFLITILLICGSFGEYLFPDRSYESEVMNMPNIPQIRIGGTDYQVKDSVAREWAGEIKRSPWFSEPDIVKVYPTSESTKEEAVRSLEAIKLIALYNYDPAKEYYLDLKRTINGIHYIFIHEVDSGTDTIVSGWAKSYDDNDAVELIPLGQQNSSGQTGQIKIDWSEVKETPNSAFTSTDINLDYMEMISASRINPVSRIFKQNAERSAVKAYPTGMTVTEAEQSLRAIKVLVLDGTGFDDDAEYNISVLQRIQGGFHYLFIDKKTSSGTVACATYGISGYTDSNNLEWINLAETNQSGISGRALIDWSEVTQNSVGHIQSFPLDINYLHEMNSIFYDYKAQSIDKKISTYQKDSMIAALATAVKNGNISESENELDLDTNLSAFLCYGQSWAAGGSVTKKYIVSYESAYHNLMLNGGIYPARYSSKHSSFAILCEDDQVHGTCFETPASGQCDMVSQLMLAENGFYNPDEFCLVTANPSVGGYSISQLSKGQWPYTNFMNAITYMKAIANGQGKTFKAEAFSFINGTLDKAAMIQLQTDISNDIKEITGQSETVKMFTWQYEVHDVSNDYYDAYVDISNNIICAFPGYIIPHIDDGANNENNIHWIPEGSRIAGEYMGIAFKRVIIDGENWSPLKPKSVRIDGNDLYVTFHVPVGTLKFDTDIVKAIDNYGFELYNSGGTAKTITSVSIVDDDIVKISCAAGIAATDILAYAYTPHESSDHKYGPTQIARGQLCDSQQIVSITGRNLANFCVAFKKPLSFWPATN